MERAAIIQELRALIVRAAPDPEAAMPVRDCPENRPLDEVIRFSSLIVLGTVVAVEDRFGIDVDGAALRRATGDGLTLARLADLIGEQLAVHARGEEPCTS